MRTLLDENEFLSPYGLRALSRYHKEHPFVLASRRAGIQRRLRAGGIDQRALRRQLQLARTDLVPAELPDDRSPAKIPLLLREHVQG